MTTARPAGSWRPILALVAVILVVGLSAMALAWRLSSRGDDPSQASCPTAALGRLDLVAAGGSAQPAQLRQAAAILRKRLSVYGCRSDVSVEGSRLRVSASHDALTHLDELIAPGELQFREVLETAGQCLPVSRAAPAAAELTACSRDGSEQYRLGLAEVVGSDVKGAVAQQDQQLHQWQVLISFTKTGQRRFTDLTTQLISKRLAIVLDGEVIAAPTIQAQIDGAAQVTGSFTADSAQALAALLRYGALPVQLQRA